MPRFRRKLSRNQLSADLSEEMQQHLEEKIEALIAGGMPRDEAVHAARRAFGNATLIEQRSREVWMWPLIESIWADIKFALRQLRKTPGLTAAVVLHAGARHRRKSDRFPYSLWCAAATALISEAAAVGSHRTLLLELGRWCQLIPGRKHFS